MITKGITKQGKYYDSVSLMIISNEINKLSGVIDSSIVMGTHENISILKVADLYISDFDKVDDTDLLISMKVEKEKDFENALVKLDELFKELSNKSDDDTDFAPKSLESAVKQMPEANLSLISIAGKYAVAEAWKALKSGLHVMLFSDNISIEDENKMKTYGLENDLLVMGPDCGTAIINGVPLAFSNVVNRGNIGIVAASGTGLQEVSSIISNEGAGISQALGTGGRDVKEEIGGKMFIRSMQALAQDDDTKIIVLVSKPPHESVQAKIAAEIKNINKPVVSILIGGDPKVLEKAGAFSANTLEEAALMAVKLSKGEDIKSISTDTDFSKIAEKETKNKTAEQKYVRGLYSGGTLCDETQLLFKDKIGYAYSNTPLTSEFLMKNVWESTENIVIDLGDDEFTAGRPHPMIDFSLRNKRIIQESTDPQVAVILLDVVLGYGANMQPAQELAPIFRQALENNPKITIIATITGTSGDPQNKELVEQELQNAGAIIMQSNASAAKLTMEIIAKLNK